MERKNRSDAGKTLTNLKKKRDQVVTPQNYFKKFKRKHHPGEVFSDAELNAAYANLSEAHRLICAQGADGLKVQLDNIEGEVQRVMQHTNGCISWRRLAEQIAGGAKNVQPIGHHALARWVMGTEGFRYTETQTLPQCTTEQTKSCDQRWMGQCNTARGDHLVKERNGLSYGVRKVTQPLMEDDENYTPNLATMEAPVRKVIGVKVCEVIEGVDADKMKKLKYALPNVDDYDISKYLDFDELQIIAGDFDDTDYNNFTDEQKERYNQFGKAFEDMSAIEYPTKTNNEQQQTQQQQE